MKNKRKKLTAYALVAVLGLSFTAYPVHAEEEQPAIENDAEIQADARDLLNTENNAGSFNVTGGTSGNEWTYDSSANTLTFNVSGDYTITGDGQQTSERIVVADNFNGTITIENINIQTEQPFYVTNTANLTLMLEGTNRLQSTKDFQPALMFQGATTGHLVIDSKNNGSLEARGQNSAGIGGGYGTGSDANNITINGGIINAYGSNDGAGIGSGYLGTASNIIINGGTVNAFGANNGGAGIGSGNGGKAESIVINGGTIHASAIAYGAGIGSGRNETAENINITGGNVTANGGNGGAGIGGGRNGNGMFITITGGTVTATSDSGAGIGGGYKGSASSNIIIDGGSVKASSISVTPTDEAGNAVYLLKLENQSGVDEVTVDDKTFTRQGDHTDRNGTFYLYLTGQDHTITVPIGVYNAEWNGSNGFDISSSPTPAVTVESATASSVTVKALDKQDVYGIAEYSLDNQNWQTSNEFTKLDADTEYTVYARYQGNDTYGQSEAGSTTVRTMKDGDALVEDSKPDDLTGVYGQKLSDISLPQGWTWADNDTALSAGEQSYPARFDTTSYEDEYDFTGISGYDSTNHSVELNLTVNVSKADSTVTINTSSLDKEYDGAAVSNPNVEKTGTTKDVAFTWYQKDGNDWKELSSAPTDAGSYKVVASVEADDNYNGTSAELEFVISQTANEWTEALSITGWTYGDKANVPAATAKYGTVTFTYSDTKDGTYMDTVPTEAGTWYVKASVTGNDSYTGLEAVTEFTITKADSIVIINTASLDKEYDGTAVSDPDVQKTGSTKDVAFTWYQKDGDNWKELSSAPTDAGSYKVVASVEADDNYNGTSAELEFVISHTANEWTEALSITGWTYGDKANVPAATAKYGTVTFTYSDTKDGTYMDTVPTEAGTWYVKATVTGNENYTGLEEVMSFEISKSIPQFEVPADLTVEQGQALLTVKLPDGFAWKDATQTANALGKQTFKAIYTPEDTENYQTVEMDITVNVVAKAVSADTTDKTQQTGVETGDSTNVFVWTALLMVSLAGAVSSVLLRRRK